MLIKVEQWTFELCEGSPLIVTEKPRNGYWEDSQNWRVVTMPSLVKSFVMPYVSVWHDGNKLYSADFSVTIPSHIKDEFLRKIMEVSP